MLLRLLLGEQLPLLQPRPLDSALLSSANRRSTGNAPQGHACLLPLLWYVKLHELLLNTLLQVLS